MISSDSQVDGLSLPPTTPSSPLDVVPHAEKRGEKQRCGRGRRPPCLSASENLFKPHQQKQAPLGLQSRRSNKGTLDLFPAQCHFMMVASSLTSTGFPSLVSLAHTYPLLYPQSHGLRSPEWMMPFYYCQDCPPTMNTCLHPCLAG